jgi:predicted lipid-binding transport protein (Tim44 family)
MFADSPGSEHPEPLDSEQSVSLPDASSVMPFEGLRAPQPLPSSPPETARWLAFAGIVVGGLLGGLIGYGVADLLTGSQVLAATGGLLFGVGGAVGVGIVAALTLRAMNEWREVQHPEADEDAP